MPVQPTYPGVYIQEAPSGVQTITGVSTSVTAFVGRALRGPTDTAVTINSFADFQRTFGGLWVNNSLGYAVNDFFNNGGNQAVIVRVVNGAVAAAGQTEDSNPLKLIAANPGTWGNNLSVSINNKVSEDVANQYGLETTDLFNMIVTDMNTGATEQYNNLTVKASPAQVDKVLLNQSNLVRAVVPLPNAVPTIPADETSITVTFSGGTDGAALLTSANILGEQSEKTGLYALESVPIFNLLCIPGYNATNDLDDTVITNASTYCLQRKAFFIIDAPSTWHTVQDAITGNSAAGNATLINLVGKNAMNCAVYFPRVQEADPLSNNQVKTFGPCGMIAGTIANIDGQSGVWKAPAGLQASLVGVNQLAYILTDNETGQLNPIAVNCLRTFPASGSVIWGARTMQGSDLLNSQWKYIPVRRFALYIEQSVYNNTQWAVFEPNDEPLWRQLNLSINSFMNNLFRQGAFQGSSTKDAYFVKCDSTTTTQDDINNGIVNIQIGFAPLKPAEFIIITIQQIAGQN